MVLPNAFIKRRLHSITGLFLSLFLFEHLFTNSLSALFLGDAGEGFIRSVNGIHDLPFLEVIELTLLLVPFLVHGYLGVVYLMEGAPNTLPSRGNAPSLPDYPRNHRYTWQRMTGLLLVFGIIAHVAWMRFIGFPDVSTPGEGEIKATYQMVVPDVDQMSKLANELGVTYQVEGDNLRIQDVDFGTAELFLVRKTFLSPYAIILYTVFVLISTFHGFNGLWTFLISWGVTLSERSQKISWVFSSCLMVVVSLFGLMAIFGGF